MIATIIFIISTIQYRRKASSEEEAESKVQKILANVDDRISFDIQEVEEQEN